MKKELLNVSVALMLLFSLPSCDHNNGENETDIQYPSTAHVIKNAVKDRDGNKYDAVKIGNQIWMASNLKTTKYADGTPIPVVSVTHEGGAWWPTDDNGGTTAVLGYPNDSEIAGRNFGILYNHFAALGTWIGTVEQQLGHDVQGVCPNGWHIPSILEWKELNDYVATNSQYMTSSKTVPKALAAQYGWKPADHVGYPGNDMDANNSTGFSAAPFENERSCVWWSCSGIDVNLYNSDNFLHWSYDSYMDMLYEVYDDYVNMPYEDYRLFAVRCVKN